MNRYRYLVFVDDGSCLYAEHQSLRAVVYSSVKVWEDVSSSNKAFIHRYIINYPERPMAKLSVGQKVKVDQDGKWLLTKVIGVDVSLVLLKFEASEQNIMV